MKIFKNRLSFRKKKSENDLFFGLHIHKTAGMTLLEQVKNQLKNEQYYINSMYAVNYRENSKELEERSPVLLNRIRFVFGHEINEYMLHFFAGKNIKLFTFLREPIDRIISWYCFDRRLRQRHRKAVLTFNEFYDIFFPRHSLCSMITKSFPSFIESNDAPLYLQAISVLKKFYFVSTLNDFSKKSPTLFEDIGIRFSAEFRKNRTNYSNELDFKNQVDFDFLREDNQNDIRLYEIVESMQHSHRLNYFGFDSSGFEQCIDIVIERQVNPFETLLKSHIGPIKHNYKVENIYNKVLARYEKDYLKSTKRDQKNYPNLLIKLYALEDNIENKRYFREKLIELNGEFGLGLEKFLRK